MSYILDALRRAERERHLGETPSVADITGQSPSPVQQRQWLLIAGGIAVLLVAVLAAVFWPHHHRAGQTIAARSQKSVRVAPAPKTVVATSKRAVKAAPVAPPPSVKIPNAGKIASFSDLEKPPAPAHPATKTAAAPLHPVDLGKTAPAEPARRTSGQTTSPSKIGSAPAASAGGTSPVTKPTAGPAPVNAEPSVTDLRNMPDSFRADFPQITVDVHYWDPTPARRFVLINMHRYKEGQTTAEGLHVVEIVQNGIVFDWHGQRVLYTLSH